MIERLNFYDLYGYVFPGFVMTALFWLPFGWTGRGWPPTEWATAAAALGVSYVVGFLLHRIGTEAVASKTSDKNGNLRHWSEIILDEDDQALSTQFKTALKVQILTDFALDVGTSDPARKDAFRECRAALVANKRATYAEQFQGLYTLSRGLFLSVGLAIPFFFGWALGVFRPILAAWTWWSVLTGCVFAVSWCMSFWGDGSKKDFSKWKWVTFGVPPLVLLVAAFILRGIPIVGTTFFEGPRRTALWVALFFVPPLLAVLTNKNRLASRWGRSSIALSTFGVVGAVGFAAAGPNVSTAHGQGLVACAVAAFMALFPLWRSYQAHTKEFAATVYRDYYAMRKVAPAKTPNDEGTPVATRASWY